MCIFIYRCLLFILVSIGCRGPHFFNSPSRPFRRFHRLDNIDFRNLDTNVCLPRKLMLSLPFMCVRVSVCERVYILRNMWTYELILRMLYRLTLANRTRLCVCNWISWCFSLYWDLCTDMRFRYRAKENPICHLGHLCPFIFSFSNSFSHLNYFCIVFLSIAICHCLCVLACLYTRTIWVYIALTRVVYEAHVSVAYMGLDPFHCPSL